MTIEMPESGETADKKQNNLYFVSIFCGGWGGWTQNVTVIVSNPFPVCFFYLNFIKKYRFLLKTKVIIILFISGN